MVQAQALCRAEVRPIREVMAPQQTTVLSGHRLVPATTEARVLHVLAVHDLGAALGVAFGGALMLSLAATAAVVHGWALAVPPLAAAGGVVWGYFEFRSALRRSAPAFPPLPADAVVLPVSAVVAPVVMRVTFVALSMAAVIAGAGHGAAVAWIAAACVAPPLYSRAMIVALLVRRSAVDHARNDGGRTVYQTSAGNARLYSAGGTDAG
jgi:hypothetical protein